MSESNAQTNAIYKSRRILLNLLERQGFDITNYKDSTVSEIHLLIQTKQLDMTVSNKTDGTKCVVMFMVGKTIRPATIQDVVDRLFTVERSLSKRDSLIVVASSDPNDTMVKMLQSLWKKESIYVTIFNIDRLQFNILEHEYVPQHRPLSETEVEDFKKKYNCQNGAIPEISRFDPVAQAIGLRPGQICEITRISKTAIQSKAYRICQS